MNFDNYLNPPDVEDITIECDNANCERVHVSWEDASKDSYGNWICDWCKDDGYLSAEHIILNCDMDDDEIEKRVGYTAWWNRVSEDTLECPVCHEQGEVYNRDAISHIFPIPHAECVCHTCNAMFFIFDL